MIKWLVRQIDNVVHAEKDFDDDTRAMGRWLLRMWIYMHVCLLPIVISSIGAIRSAWEEHRFVAVFAEQFTAEWLFIFDRLGGWFVVGAVVGMKVWQRTKRKIVSWGVGIAVIFVLWGVTSALARSIPGVSWRYEEIVKKSSESEPSDYDPY